MSKRLFQALDEMVTEDAKNETRLVAISSTLVSAEKVRQGCTVTVGADEQVLMDLMNDKAMAILVVVNKEEYFNRTK